MRRILLAGASALALAVPAGAADLALVLTNSEYDEMPDVRLGTTGRAMRGALEEAGFRVFAASDADGAALRRLAADFADAVPDDEQNRLVVMLGGHLAAGAGGVALMGVEAEEPGVFDTGAVGLPLVPLMDILGTAPGQAVLLLSPGEGAEYGPGLTGVAGVEAPAGVTVARGPASGLVTLLRNALLAPGASYADAAAEAGRGVELSGFVSGAVGLLPAEGGGAAPAAETGQIAYWNAVQDIGTTEAMRAYLSRYPQGLFAADARRMIEELEQEPARRAEAGEQALDLSRDQRRQVQRNLSLVGFDPRGIDGIFGRGSRAAIADWQGANGYERTGFLTGPQVDRLSAAAEVRARELEEEARRRQEAEEQADRAYWRDLGEGRDEAALRAYLGRYPDGIYADVAQQRIDAIEDERRGQVEREQRESWDRAQARDTVEAYRSFLTSWPQGAFADAARARLTELEEADRNSAAVEAARQAEGGIVTNTVTRLLVERRLQQLNFDPGATDGSFDATTRRAIRRFQRGQGLSVTGYIDQATMVRLLAVR